jgi:hypothetical protein
VANVQTVDDSVVRKIQLLLNLAARSEGNEAEAAAAMARAQEILAKYNLDLATVQDKVVTGGTAEREAESKRDYALSKRSAMYKWQQNLVRAIAEANYCIYWIAEVKEQAYIPPKNRKSYEDYDENGMGTIHVKRHRVLGRVANTTGVMIMVDYLLDTIERLLPYPQAQRLSREANLWREGCADRLVERVNAKAEAMRKADYATQGEQQYSVAIQVAAMAEKEEAGNYDHQHGAGAWAKRKARNAEMDLYWSDEAVAAREAKREAEIAAKRALETPAQRKAREREEERERKRQERASEAYSRRYWARADREAERAEARRESSAYRAGSDKGNSIGLDAQVSASTTKNLK